MLSPSLSFELLLGTVCGALVHLVLGGGGRLLFSFVVAGWVGAIIGQVVGDVMDVHILMVGTTNLLTCVLGACLAIGLMVLLFWQRVPHRAHRRLD